MPSAPKIRAKILSVLNKQVIPALKSQAITQVLAKPPFDFSGVPRWTVQQALLPNKTNSELEPRLHWEGTQLTALRHARLSFSYHGVSDQHVGATLEMAEQLKKRGALCPPGITAFQMSSPSSFYIPANTPHCGVTLPEEEYGTLRKLYVWFAEDELRVNHFDAAEGATHHLSISNPALNRLGQEYFGALSRRNFWVAQSLLLDLMILLKDHLAAHPAAISNTSWPSLDEKFLPVAAQISPRVARHCYQAIDYIQFHLHTSLSLEVLARVCGVTAPYLSRVFRKTTGTTVMNYVTERRIRAAELMLSTTPERIGDIAALVGFSSSHSFAGVFQRHHGMSPSQYRQRFTSHEE